MISQESKLILIDGNSLLYRAFYALPPLSTKKGIPTGGVYGFTRILIKLLKEEKPDYMACAFDKGKKTFRHKKWKDYKITRPETPKELSLQIPLVKKILEAFKIPVFEEEEYEADDIIATLAKKGEKAGLKVKIFTGDKDIFQIISPSVVIVRFKRGISKTETFDIQKVKEEFGVYPEQIADYLSLVGDTSDNIPGVPGIGPKGAKELIKNFGNVENILSNIDRLPPNLATKIKENVDKIKLSKKLATIFTEVPLEFNLEKLKVKNPDLKALLEIFKELEFKELIKSISTDESLKKEKNSENNSPSHSLLILSMHQENSNFKIAISSYSSEEKIILLTGEPEENHQEKLIENLKKNLSSPDIKKVGHDLKNIAVNLRKWGINLKGIEFDTGIAAYLLNPSLRKYTLERISLEFLGEKPKDLSLASLHNLIKRLHPILQNQLKTKKMWHLFEKVEMPLIEVLVEMEIRGVKIDTKFLKEFLEEVKEKRIKLEKEIYGEVGEKFNLNSSQQVGKILFEKLKLPSFRKTKTGYSTSEEVLKTLSSMHPCVKKILQYRHLLKLESSYIKPLLKMVSLSTGRIHTSFSQTTASTGRLSSFKPNLQNIPVKEKLSQKIRKSFIAEKGHLLLSADYSQIELRILAHLSQDKHLISAFLRGEDIHRETAAEIFGVLPLGVTPEMRRKAKAVNFGIIYGISPFGLARSLEITEKEAQEYINLYFSRYPEVKNYIEKTIDEAKTKGFVKTLMGRTRYIPWINSSNIRRRKLAERIAINSVIQGSAADLIKLAMINLYHRIKKEESTAWIVLQIHDELLLEVQENEIERTRKIVKEEMEKVVKLSVPLVVETKIGRNWYEMS